MAKAKEPQAAALKTGTFEFKFEDGKDTKHVTFARDEKGLVITLAGYGWAKDRAYRDVTAGWREQNGVSVVAGEVKYFGRHPFEFRIDCGSGAVSFSIDGDPAKKVALSADQCARATTFVRDCIARK